MAADFPRVLGRFFSALGRPIKQLIIRTLADVLADNPAPG
jgi:hypothetical protein